MSAPSTNRSISKAKIHELASHFNNDLDLTLFFLKWLEMGQNATRAYQELHPGTEYGTAATLGWRLLKKVEIGAVMEAYGAGLESYMRQLIDGLKAEKRDQFTGEMYPDHATRKAYHDKQGKLLGIEKDSESYGMEFKNGEKSIKITVTRGNAAQ